MQHQTAGALASPSQCYALSIAEPLAAGMRPPRMPRAAGGVSGRPRCRIYARGSIWVLEFDSPFGGSRRRYVRRSTPHVRQPSCGDRLCRPAWSALPHREATSVA